MASLSAHLRQSEEHGLLRFHPDCPVCRGERLSGTLAVQGAVTRRAQAAVVATLLAASTATPTIALAQESDQVSEGTLAPGDTAADPALNPDFDPGGDSEDLPFDDPQAPESDSAPDPGAGDLGPVEGEPVTDVGAPVADAGDGMADPVVVSPSPTPTPTPPPMAPPVPAPDDAVDSPGAAEPVAAPHVEKAHRKRERRRSADVADADQESPSVSPTAVVDEAPPEPTTIVVAQATPAPPTVSKRNTAKRGDRYHVVQPGESLWLIAGDLVGHDASAARIAREVHRLWTNNRTRIATGDPDLLMVGTKLAVE
jgi:hypothetical protein